MHHWHEEQIAHHTCDQNWPNAPPLVESLVQQGLLEEGKPCTCNAVHVVRFRVLLLDLQEMLVSPGVC